MGATAFQKGLGAVHAIAHPVGSFFDTHHGLTNAVIMPYVIVHNRDAIAERMKVVARVLELQKPGIDGVLDWVLSFRKELGIPHSLGEIGVTLRNPEEIGREAAIQLARRRHRVVLAARDAGALNEVARQIEADGGQAEVLPLDLTEDASVARAVSSLLASGPCDVVVNNAGCLEQREFLLRPAETLRSEMELNYWGVVRLTRALLPTFIARGAGVIVTTFTDVFGFFSFLGIATLLLDRLG